MTAYDCAQVTLSWLMGFCLLHMAEFILAKGPNQTGDIIDVNLLRGFNKTVAALAMDLVYANVSGLN